tara:strand:- start:8054 stop:8323 length:270 start_codon:yes stop_codon:yes gene_type:complete
MPTQKSTEITHRLESLLRPHLRLLAAEIDLAPDQHLGQAGLDSLASIELLVQIEDEFGAMIPDEAIDENTFTSLTTLAQVVSRSLPNAA